MIHNLYKLKNDLMKVFPDKEKQSILNMINVVDNHDNAIDYFKRGVLLLNKTIEDNDKSAIQYALIVIRIAAMSLSNYYLGIWKDAELINRDPTWPPIPEDYQLPQIYDDYLSK